MNPIVLVGAGILLIGIGMGLGYWFAHGQRKREATRADEIQNELDDYRQQVTEHFGETAQHFHTLGQQYQSLYKHMAQGADSLCDTAQSDALLGFAAGKVAALVADDAAPDQSPEVIRDYAPVEEDETAQVEAGSDTEIDAEIGVDAEPLISIDAVTDASDADKELPDLEVEESLVEQAATPDSDEKDRIVH